LPLIWAKATTAAKSSVTAMAVRPNFFIPPPLVLCCLFPTYGEEDSQRWEGLSSGKGALRSFGLNAATACYNIEKRGCRQVFCRECYQVSKRA